MRALHLFAGIGGSCIAAKMLGFESAGAVEIDPFCRKVLRKNGERMVGSDVTKFSFSPERHGRIDIVIGGSPCQDLSRLGKRAGLAGERSGLWSHQLRIAVESGAEFLWWENVAGAFNSNNGRDFERILLDLDESGFDAAWVTNTSSGVGAPHVRQRIFLVGHANKSTGKLRTDVGQHSDASHASHADITGLSSKDASPHSQHAKIEPRLGGAAYGVPPPVDCATRSYLWPASKGQPPLAHEAPRLVEKETGLWRQHRNAALGNAWNPYQAVQAWHFLYENLMGKKWSHA